jgi:hypothetical protein
VTTEERRRILSEAGKLGAAVLHLGTTLDERRDRTAAARAARAAKRSPRKPTLAEKIAAVEATLPGLDANERARQEAWIAAAKELSASLAAAS